ncbi:MAG: polysaccharide biosynthesis/export family protein [Sedimentisphaerales bacterium]|nr:polysaccharide biosynthesis/export family protein [Sedimentisphaerales bacterium]
MHKQKMRILFIKIVFISICIFIGLLSGGCGPTLSTPAELEKFNNAAPINAEKNLGYPIGVKSYLGPYRVIPGDVIEFQMPAVLRVISSDLPEWLRPTYGRTEFEPYLVRVSQDGTIIMPIIGEINVAGKTLSQIEASIVDAYYPKYVVNRPMVVCEIEKYQRESERVFAVIGLVNKSGIYPYPADVQYNLMEALAFASGLDMVSDPRYLKIYRQDDSGQVLIATMGVDSKSLSDAYKFTIQPGDLIYVDHTLRTRVNKFMSDVFHITVGAESRYSYD